MKRAILLSSLLILSSTCTPPKQPEPQNMIEQLLQSHPQWFSKVLENKELYQPQIIYTQIDRDDNNRPHFTTYTYNVDAQRYFYPASTVKFPAAVLALEKLNELNMDGLDRETALAIDSSASQSGVKTDETAPDSLPTIGHYIRKIFLVSDNDAFNRLYEFLGQETINKNLWNKGYKKLRINHRLSIAISVEENRHTNAFTFYDGNKVIYRQDAQYNKETYPLDLPNLQRGKGYWNGERVVDEPFDFSGKNYFALQEQQAMLRAVIFPDAVPQEKRFNLTPDDYRFLYKTMSMLPRESKYPAYDPEKYWDSYVKFVMFGDNKERMSNQIRVFNKVGDAYGFLTENAYVADFENNVEFFLSVTIHVNENLIYNDNNYAYDEVGFPFIANLGRVIHDYELKRQRPHKADLTRLKQAIE